MTDRGSPDQSPAAPLPEPLTRAERCRRLWDISGSQAGEAATSVPRDIAAPGDDRGS